MQHIDVIADRNRQRAAGTTLADDGTQNRHTQSGQFVQVASDGFGLTALFRSDARVRARRIDKSHHRNIEFLGGLHQTQCFAVAFRARHTEIAADFFFGVAAFLMADNHHTLSIEARQTADDGMVV